ncbi:Redoxin domain-containing protein [Rhodovastum atsumiense]|nr:peroxiredoxin-like family protein [Rhodovastum atsumiense]CAH2604603.1 Redoxin domain-containing protein [Rhodovastum atsumiense]
MGGLVRQLEAFMQGLLERTDPATARTLRGGIERLVRDGVAQRAPGPGTPAPDFILPDQDGREVSLSRELGRGPVVLTFFRGGWCPFCTITLRALARIHPALCRHQAQVLAVSPQGARHCADTVLCNQLPFRVLGDHDNQVARRYGLPVTLSPELQDIYRRFGHDLPAINGVDAWELPIPATFLIGTDGRIRQAHVDPRPHRRMEPEQVLAGVETLAALTE